MSTAIGYVIGVIYRVKSVYNAYIVKYFTCCVLILEEKELYIILTNTCIHSICLVYRSYVATIVVEDSGESSNAD